MVGSEDEQAHGHQDEVQILLVHGVCEVRMAGRVRRKGKKASEMTTLRSETWLQDPEFGPFIVQE